MDYLTATDFYQYVQCPHWPYFERFATDDEKKMKRDVTESEQRRMENGVAHEHDAVAKIFADGPIQEVPRRTMQEDFDTTLALMREGVPLIYQGALIHGDWAGRPDLLERQEGESVFGSWHYVPVDVKTSHALEKYQKLQLTFYAVLLEKIQKRFPPSPAIINIDHERLSFVAADFLKEFDDVVVELERIRAGERPLPVLRKSCYDTGPWGVACERLAKMNDDIAQLYNVDVRKLRLLREVGVHTVRDAAEMDPMALDGAAPGLRLHGLEVIHMQARSLLHKEVIIRKPVTLPTEGLEIHFDIESDTPNDRDYLYGFLIREPSGDRYHAFVSESGAGEERLWKDFLAWIETLPEKYTIYHFAVMEKTRLGVLEKRYEKEPGTNPALERFRANMVDLKEVANSSIVFPLYFYGLKYIAPFLGFSWTGDVKGGGQSVDVYEQFLETGTRKLLDSIIEYNTCDVRATAHLKDWLVNYAGELTSYEEPYPWKK